MLNETGSRRKCADQKARRVTPSLVASFGCVSIIWLVGAISLVLISAIPFSATGHSAWTGWSVVIWTISAGLVFLRPVETLLAEHLWGVREALPAERTRLVPAWQRVCDAAGVSASNYTVLVEPRGGVHAFATGMRTVAVTSDALRRSDVDLEPILAHELGHHLDMHPIPGALAAWYLTPVALLVRIVNLLITVINVLGAAFGSSGVVGVLCWGIGTWLWIWVWLLQLPIRLAFVARTLLRQRQEYAADRHAADLGYASELMAILGAFLEEEERAGGPPRSLRSRLQATHPPLHSRILRLERYQAEMPERAIVSSTRIRAAVASVPPPH